MMIFPALTRGVGDAPARLLPQPVPGTCACAPNFVPRQPSEAIEIPAVGFRARASTWTESANATDNATDCPCATRSVNCWLCAISQRTVIGSCARSARRMNQTTRLTVHTRTESCVGDPLATPRVNGSLESGDSQRALRGRRSPSLLLRQPVAACDDGSSVAGRARVLAGRVLRGRDLAYDVAR